MLSAAAVVSSIAAPRPVLPPSRPLLPSPPPFYLHFCPLLPSDCTLLPSMLPVVTIIVPVVTLSVAPCYLDCCLLLPSSDTRLTAVCGHSDSRRLRCYHSPLAFLSLTHRSLSFHPAFSLAVNDRMYRNTGTKASGLKRKQRNDDGDEQQRRPPLPLHANRARAAASPVSRASPITVLATLSAAAPYSLQDLNPPLPPSAPSSPTLSFSRPSSLAPYQLSNSPIPIAQLCLSMLIDPSPSPTPVSPRHLPLLSTLCSLHSV